MALSSVASAASFPPTSQLAVQSASGHHKHGHHASSISDVAGQSSSDAPPPSSLTGKVGSQIDLTV